MTNNSQNDKMDPRMVEFLQSPELRPIIAMLGRPGGKEYATRDQLLEARAKQTQRMLEFLQKQKSKASKPKDATLQSKSESQKRIRKLWAPQNFTSDTATVISSPDNNEIQIHMVRRKEDENKILPCVYYIHGGAMATGSAFDPMYKVWARIIALQVMILLMSPRTVSMDFRVLWLLLLTSATVRFLPSLTKTSPLIQEG
eukprot:m.59409 g.59409  ORF g.59409 m.59409 type:complete len:200 (+) comp11244_c0_seq3:112-711(+)